MLRWVNEVGRVIEGMRLLDGEADAGRGVSEALPDFDSVAAGAFDLRVESAVGIGRDDGSDAGAVVEAHDEGVWFDGLFGAGDLDAVVGGIEDGFDGSGGRRRQGKRGAVASGGKDQA